MSRSRFRTRRLAPLLVALSFGACSGDEAPGPGERGAATDEVAATSPGDDIARAGEVFQEGRTALESGDTLAFLVAMKEANALRPGHQTLILQTAWAFAMNDSLDASMRTLLEYAAHGFVPTTNPADISDFAGVLDHPGWEDFERAVESNRREVGTASRAFGIETRDFVPEGLAHDPQTGDFYLGSVHRG